jgi:hypothetical protein
MPLLSVLRGRSRSNVAVCARKQCAALIFRNAPVLGVGVVRTHSGVHVRCTTALSATTQMRRRTASVLAILVDCAVVLAPISSAQGR